MRRQVIALTLIAATALPLSGCLSMFGNHLSESSSDDTAAETANSADQAAQMTDTLAGTDWSKTSKLVVRNAETGEEIALITNQALIEDAVSGLSDINSVAAEPDASPEYVVEVWQPETIRFGETEPSGDTCVLELTTYQDSDVVGLSVSLLDISLYMHVPTTAEELRTLAQ